MILTVVEVVLGAIVSILITIWIERTRKPKLTIRVVKPVDVEYENRPANKARFLNLEVVNEPLRRGLRWMQRNPAVQCHGTITFRSEDGQVLGSAMPIRWCSSPEPITVTADVSGQPLLIADPGAFSLTPPRIDIQPGEGESLTVAAKFDDESDCYGWTNENYFSNPRWRNPIRRLPPGNYIANVTIFSAGEKCSGTFRLVNGSTCQDFSLQQLP